REGDHAEPEVGDVLARVEIEGRDRALGEDPKEADDPEKRENDATPLQEAAGGQRVVPRHVRKNLPDPRSAPRMRLRTTTLAAASNGAAKLSDSVCRLLPSLHAVRRSLAGAVSVSIRFRSGHVKRSLGEVLSGPPETRILPGGEDRSGQGACGWGAPRRTRSRGGGAVEGR